jgi:lauroyl/myristoyl acyltransferase
MTEEIELGGIKVPLVDLETTPESNQAGARRYCWKREKETKQKNRRACEEKLNKNLEKLIIPTIEEWIWSQGR